MRIPAALKAPLAWICVGLLLRIAFAFFLGEGVYQADEYGWYAQARFWAEHRVFGGEGGPAVVTPVPILLFGVPGLLGPSKIIARLAQAVVGTAAVWALGKTTQAATGSARAGLIATAIAAVYPFFIYYSGVLMSETVYIFMVVSALGMVVVSIRERGARLATAAGAGLFWSLAGLSRTEGVPIALFLWASLAALAATGRYAPKALLLAGLCWAMPLAAWAARNHGIVGRYTLDTHGGITLLDGTMNFDLNEQDTTFARQAFKQTEIYRAGEKLPEFERDAHYRAAAFRWMRAHPGETARQWIHKAFNFWRLYPRLDKETPASANTNATAGVRGWVLTAVSLCSEPALIGLGFWGALLLRARFSELFPLYWMVLGTFGIHVIVISQMRYRLPVMAVLILFAAYRLSLWLPAGEGA